MQQPAEPKCQEYNLTGALLAKRGARIFAPLLADQKLCEFLEKWFLSLSFTGMGYPTVEGKRCWESALKWDYKGLRCASFLACSCGPAITGQSQGWKWKSSSGKEIRGFAHREPSGSGRMGAGAVPVLAPRPPTLLTAPGCL